jgi:TonB-linked SusC/RagA family outer membrane protein
MKRNFKALSSALNKAWVNLKPVKQIIFSILLLVANLLPGKSFSQDIDFNVINKKNIETFDFLMADRTAYNNYDTYKELSLASKNSESDFILQQLAVTGRVTDVQTGDPLPGVNVLVEGTTVGVNTDTDGRYSITAPRSNSVLIFSFIGYTTLKEAIGGRSTINIQLSEEVTALSEVVVTALGIKREARSVGYATSTVDMESLHAATTNVGSALTGKIAGVNAAAMASGGAGGSSKIRIRGLSSFGSDNSPLIVVNGSPIDNTPNRTSRGGDTGDGLVSINENDIETMTVLKGSVAAALYGYRAKDGAILITTKSGTRRTGIGIEYSMKASTDKALDYTDFQYEYGEGLDGYRQQTVAQALSMGTWSFGEKMDGKPTIMYDGTMHPYSPFRDRYDLFYRRGMSLSNTLSFSGGDQKGTYRLSFSNTDANAIIEKSDLHVKSINFALNYNLTQKITLTSNINYSNEKNDNPIRSSGKSSINETVQSVNNSTPEVVLRKYENPDGTEMHYCRYTSKLNPFWIINKNFEYVTRDRIFGNASVTYKILDNLFIKGQISQDYYTRADESNTATGQANLGGATIGFNGNYQNGESILRELNADFLAGYNQDLGNFAVNLTFGGTMMNRRSQGLRTSVNNFYVRDLYSIGNGQTKTPSQSYSHKKVNSLYGAADISFKNYLFLSVTGRNDWFSTLNPASNSYLYPSVSLSAIFSDIIGSRPSWLDYGKVRMAYAEVGGDTDPYQDALSYSINTNTLGNSPFASISNSVSPNPNLKPLKVKELEFGLELRTLGNRVNLDLSLYNKNTVDEILNVDISNTSGYNQTKVNIGKLRNRGVEWLFTAVPVTGRNFSWESVFSGSYNISKVLQLAHGQSKFDVAYLSADYLGWISHEVGKPLASIRVYDYKRDSQGRMVVNNGLPMQGEVITMGSAIPKWLASWTNNLAYKNWTFSTMFDLRWGNVMISETHYGNLRFGLAKETLLGREGGVTVDAVNVDGTPNEASPTSYAYFSMFSDGYVGTVNVFDGSFIKWRSVSLGYDLSNIVTNTFIRKLTVAANCYNVLLIKKYIPNIDPEGTSETSDFMSGVEFFACPTTRNFGISLNASF